MSYLARPAYGAAPVMTPHLALASGCLQVLMLPLLKCSWPSQLELLLHRQDRYNHQSQLHWLLGVLHWLERAVTLAAYLAAYLAVTETATLGDVLLHALGVQLPPTAVT